MDGCFDRFRGSDASMPPGAVTVPRPAPHGAYLSATAAAVGVLLGAVDARAAATPFGAGFDDWVMRVDGYLAGILRRGGEFLTDGIVLYALGLLFLGAILVRQLRALPRGYTFAFLAITAVGAALRVALSEPTLLDAWPYSRCTPLARLIYEGPVLQLLGGTHYLTDIIFDSNLALAIVTPCAIFAHARYLFRDPRIAITAAGLLAVLPNHIRFARSDVAFIQLILLSCLAFVALHQALGDPSRRRRVVAMAVLPLLCVAAFDSRPLACNLGPLLVATAWLLVPAEVPRSRRILATALVALAMAYDIHFHLLGRHASQVHEGLAIGTFVRGFLGIFSSHNTLLLPRVTPLGLTALSAVGMAVLWRRGEPIKALFLLAWLLGFYLSLGFVLSPITDMQARYHLHLVEPFVQLSAVGLVAVLSWRRWAGVALAAYTAASPLVHIGFVRDVGFSLPAEFTFLTTLRERIPQGCTVLEFMGPDPGMPGDPLHLARIAEAVQEGERGFRWKILSTGALNGQASPIREEIVELLRDPPACLYLYEGMRCYTEKAFDVPFAPACEALRSELDLELVVEDVIPNRVYDHELSQGLGSKVLEVDAHGYFAKPVMEQIPVKLYRVEVGERAALAAG